MIPALLIWLYNRYATSASKRRAQKIAHDPNQRLLTPKLLFLPLLLCFAAACTGTEKTVHYRVMCNGNVIGQAVFQHRTEGQDIFLKMSSSINARFVFNIRVNTTDVASFRNGQLLNSSVYRKVNGKEKEAKHTRWDDRCYRLQSGSRITTYSNSIPYNMLLLYYIEPVGRSTIYSDNFQEFLAIKQIAAHTYRINLPDGNYNNYYFKNGICKLVEIHHSLYTIKMELI